ncbi:MAG: hydroxymethylglutaryl-CoA reductase, degradative [Chitinophagales bacterium]|nr:hydroxymethylglutaryl-CoA reductase, degradative [Chitinophagales bacterium]
MKKIDGYSKLSKDQQMNWLIDNFFDGDKTVKDEFAGYLHRNPEIQDDFDEFAENTITNFYLPLGIAPNFLINGEMYALPMAIEESSVVAAMSKTAKFWLTRGGFHTEIINFKKIGQVHFEFKGNVEKLKKDFPTIKASLLEDVEYLNINMKARGGGILDIELVDLSHKESHLFQLKASFDTCDSMGANYINTNLEELATLIQEKITEEAYGAKPYIIMSIVSNYTPDCLARAWVECPIEELGIQNGISPQEFATKFRKAIRIAEVDPHRATTHNKGIFNGVDAIIIATGNDFRAVEACGHTYASRGGEYSSLTHCSIEEGRFKFWIDLPLAVGTVGGLTQLHPLVKRCLQILDFPDAKKLMQVVAVGGLAQNFAAVRAMTTVGIQKGHMKMHLLNILKHLEATEEEKEYAIHYFKDKVVSFTNVRVMLDQIRTNHSTPKNL